LKTALSLKRHETRRQFPATSKSFPCYMTKIPCSVEQGIGSQELGLLHKSCLKSPPTGPNAQNSLLFSLLAGNLTCETGSTANWVRHHTVLRKRRFPGSVRIAPNWRRFVHAFCLCNLPIGLQGPFRGLCLCPGKLRFPAAETAVGRDSVRMLLPIELPVSQAQSARPFRPCGRDDCGGGRACAIEN
jgi:hypothetical protein